MSGSPNQPMGMQQQSMSPQGGASYNNSARPQNMGYQSYSPYQNQNMNQNQMGGWLQQLLSNYGIRGGQMQQRPQYQRPGGLGQGMQMPGSNPTWQPQPVAPPMAPAQTTLGGGGFTVPQTMAQQLQEAQNKLTQVYDPAVQPAYGTPEYANWANMQSRMQNEQNMGAAGGV